MFWTLLGIALSFSINSFGAAIVDPSIFISLKGKDLPAKDLQYITNGKKRTLSPDEAWALKTKENLDLSLLEPDDTTNMWTGTSTEADEAKDDAIPVNNEETVKFTGFLRAVDGTIKFNIEKQVAASSSQTFIIQAGKTLHNLFLRKNLLRRLGYQIAPIKYLPQIRIKLADVFSKTIFLASLISNGDGEKERWVVPEQQGDDPLIVTLQDVAVMEAGVSNNVAMGPPIDINNPFQPQDLRILKALAVPFGLVDFAESVNEADWYVGRIESKQITFRVGDIANFACTLDDALWILRRLSKLKREDYEKIVKEAYFPDDVALVFIEKLIARRNSLMDIFNLKTDDIPASTRITHLPDLKDGKILKKEWPGYASHFAWNDEKSPLVGLGWYGLSMLQSNTVENLILKANNLLPGLKIADQINKHGQEMYTNAVAEFIKTGENKEQSIGAWVAPLWGMGFDISRNVVIGAYLGTNNLVQLADTVSFNANAGLVIGFDGLEPSWGLQGVVQGRTSLSLTHIKPIKGLKEAITEPIKNEIVPWLYRSGSNILKIAADVKNHQAGHTPDEIAKEMAEDLSQLKKIVDVGESLLLTESIDNANSVTASVSGGFPLSPSVGLTVGNNNSVVLSRIHFFRKDTNTIEVYRDDGEVAGLNVSFQYAAGGSARLPVVSLSGKTVVGEGRSKIFKVNINPDPKQNPKVFETAAALSAVLGSASVKPLEDLIKPLLPAKIKVKFHDSSSSFQFFHLMRRTLKTNGIIDVQMPNGDAGRFLSLSEGKQTGSHYQTLATDAANFLIQKLTDGSNVNVNTQGAPNPGQSLLGHSQTRNVSFQSKFDDDITLPYVRIQYRWEGWNISVENTKKLIQSLKARYGYKLYDDEFLFDAQSIKLYYIALALNLYEPGLMHLLSMSPEDESHLEEKYSTRNGCVVNLHYPENMTKAQRDSCKSQSDFKDTFEKIRKGETDKVKSARQIMKLASHLEQFTDFDDFMSSIGGENNLYLASSIKGFRTGSEVKIDQEKTIITARTKGLADLNFPNGVIDSLQDPNILGVGDGELYMQWLRDIL